MGYFDAEKDLGADEAVLVSQRADGKTIEKTLPYDSTKGQTTRRANLWVNTLFQKALLDIGSNSVSYQLKQGGAVRASGSFNATVTPGPTYTCRNETWNSSTANDCTFPDQQCRSYFARNNWCQ